MPKTTNTSRGSLGTNALDPEYREEHGLDETPETGPEPSDDAPGAWEQAQEQEAKDAAPEDIDEPGSDWRDETLAVNDPDEPSTEDGEDLSDGNSSLASENNSEPSTEPNSQDGPPPVSAPTAGLRSVQTPSDESDAPSTDGTPTEKTQTPTSEDH